MLACMGEYNALLAQAGVLVDLSGLQGSKQGFRVAFKGGRKMVLDGPFTETKELIAGYWIIDVKSRQEALDWAMQAPNPYGEADGYIEVRRFFELEDFTPGPEVDKAKELEFPGKRS
jgi:hypothetical protein